jgi:citrate synthase
MDRQSEQSVNSSGESILSDFNLDNSKGYIVFKGKVIELPIIHPSIGDCGLDIGTLYNKHKILTVDPGFKSTCSCESKITYIDGDKGELLYRGYAIEDLARSQSYLDICYLLWHGEIPKKNQSFDFEKKIKDHTLVHEQLRIFFNGFLRTSHPMAMMCGIIGALSSFYHDSLDVHNPEHRELSAIRLIAKFPTIAAMSYKYSIGQPFVYPRNDLGYVDNFLYMIFSLPTETYTPLSIEKRALEMIMILHADHEQNASTSTVRISGSSGADPFACMAAGITALWGPAHGGANQSVIEMLEEIADPSRIGEFVEKVKNKSCKLMGFGHRVYKNFDPRASILKDLYTELLLEKGQGDDPLFEIAKQLEKTALEDPYFIERKLYPNVDFYSGLLLRKMNIPTSMFTVIFSMSRVIGWISHWNEMISDESMVIARPRQIYTGALKRKVSS